ncbi:MAG: diacylglycerol kinase family lipid kinase [Clostridia bacterium]|nr:diacylglycerol kinase family lipid kinase [Clostridia bacterium]
MQHVFIVNPAAGKGKALKMAERIKERFESLKVPYKIEVTQAPGHAVKLAQEAVRNYNTVRLYSVGGDGTLNEIVNGIAGTHAELGIIPCGSGNDAVRSLYPVTDPFKLLDVLPEADARKVDLGKINDQYFINIASIGFDAEVTLKSRAFKRYPLVSGSLAYILGILSALIELKRYKVKLTIDECIQPEQSVLMSVFANGSYYGGGLIPAPRAKMTDGILDFCVVEPLTRRKIFKFFPAFQKGRHESMKEVRVIRGTRALIESDTPLPVNIDGETTKEKRVAIELLPGFINVVIPQV